MGAEFAEVAREHHGASQRDRDEVVLVKEALVNAAKMKVQSDDQVRTGFTMGALKIVPPLYRSRYRNFDKIVL